MLIMPLVIQTIADDTDRAFMERLFITYHRLMFATAWKYCKERHTVEDIVSDSCISFIHHLEKIKTLEGDALRLYIITAVRNTALNALHYQQQVNARCRYMPEKALAQIPSGFNTEKQAALKDELSLVLYALSTLPEKEQAVLRLKYSTDYTDEEIAEMVGLSVSSVRKYIARAREKVRAIVYGKGGTQE